MNKVEGTRSTTDHTFPEKRTIRAYYVGMFLYWGALYVYSPILSVYAQSLGASFTTVGVVVGAYGFVQMWLRIPLGIWSDRLGRRLPFLYAGHFFNLVGCLGLAMAPTPMYLVIFRGVLGISAATWVAFTVLFASYFPANQSPKAMGIITAINGISLITVNGFGGQIAQMWGMGATFYAGAVLAAIGLIATVPIKEHRTHREPPTFRQIWRIITHPALMLVASITALNHYAFWGDYVWLCSSLCGGSRCKQVDARHHWSSGFGALYFNRSDESPVCCSLGRKSRCLYRHSSDGGDDVCRSPHQQYTTVGNLSRCKWVWTWSCIPFVDGTEYPGDIWRRPGDRDGGVSGGVCDRHVFGTNDRRCCRRCCGSFWGVHHCRHGFGNCSSRSFNLARTDKRSIKAWTGMKLN